MSLYEWQPITRSKVIPFSHLETRIQGHIEFAGTDKDGNALVFGWILDSEKLIKNFVLIRERKKRFFQSPQLEAQTIEADVTQSRLIRISRQDVEKKLHQVDAPDSNHGFMVIIKNASNLKWLGVELQDGRYLTISIDQLITARDIRVIFQILWPIIGKYLVDLFHGVLDDRDTIWQIANHHDQTFDSHTDQPMVRKSLRLDCTEVEKTFVQFKNRVREVEESIVPITYCERIQLPPLVKRPLTTTEIVQLTDCAPWGYSFSITENLTAFQLDQFSNKNLQPTPTDVGLLEMQLRMSVLSAVLRDFSEPTDNWLDIATNCGVIPLLSQKIGYRFNSVVGIDYQEANVWKADLLKTLADATDIEFVRADAFAFTKSLTPDQYEIVSALGLFYHLSDPISLLVELFRVTKRVLIIDTVVHNFDFSGWIQTISRHTKDEGLSHANDARKIIELHPTRRGMVDSLFQVGFSNVIEFQPSRKLLDLCPSEVHEQNNRTFLVALKI